MNLKTIFIPRRRSIPFLDDMMFPPERETVLKSVENFESNHRDTRSLPPSNDLAHEESTIAYYLHQLFEIFTALKERHENKHFDISKVDHGSNNNRWAKILPKKVKDWTAQITQLAEMFSSLWEIMEFDFKTMVEAAKVVKDDTKKFTDITHQEEEALERNLVKNIEQETGNQLDDHVQQIFTRMTPENCELIQGICNIGTNYKSYMMNKYFQGGFRYGNVYSSFSIV